MLFLFVVSAVVATAVTTADDVVVVVVVVVVVAHWFDCCGDPGCGFVCLVNDELPNCVVGELCESPPAETRLTVYRRPQ